jgi:DNA-binding CsgD family transcriptional regulator
MDSGPIGRDGEIADIWAFLLSATSGSPAALTITGDPGIGKTIVWKHVVQAASHSSRVLSCQPASAERPLAFSALDDLFGVVAGEVLPALSGPRRRAVEAALLHEASPETPPADLLEAGRLLPERRVLARGVLDVLRILSERSPLVLAVDDTQWLDRPSASVLEFCFRRLEHEPVWIVLTLRTDIAVFPLGLDRALPPDRLRRVRLGPLSLGVIGEILRSRMGVVLPRYTLTRLYEACGGNPFYALECARALPGLPRMPRTNEPIPLPENLSDLVRRRVRRLALDARQVGRLVAASSEPRERVIRAACDDGESWAAIDQAIEGGILERDGELLRFTHPLLRSVAYADMTPSQRRDIHRRLAASTEDIEERAWHLALGADRPGEEIAQVLDRAARHAASRGAPEAAAALAEQAARLTPADRSGAARDRVVHAANYHFRGGDMDRSCELIQSALAACPSGPVRARLLLRLATIYYHNSGWPLAEQTFRQAVDAAPDDPALRAHAEQEIAFARLVAGDLPGALDWAKASLRSAEQSADPLLMAHSLARIAALEFFRGNGVRTDLLARAEALDAPAGDEPGARASLLDPPLARGVLLKWCDRLDDARLRLAGQYHRALGRGDEALLPFLLYHFSELECWAGNWDAAEEYALEGCRVADESRQRTMKPATLYTLALVRAHRGRVEQAREFATEALALCDQTGNVPIMSLLLSVLGFAALSLDDHQAAHSHLGRLADVATVFGLGEPGVVKFLPDEIEALTALGEVGRARSLTHELEVRGKSLGRPWAQATGARCRALLAAVDGDLSEARSACEQALSHHKQLPMPFELARTLLVKGMIERRARYRQTARESLGQALTSFERLGAPLWAAKAQRELSKITTRPCVHGLTETESHVAALVTQGLTNREIGSAMFITENTVQTHIRHIFQKLGVRSRTELAARFPPILASTMTAAARPGDESLR